MSYFISKQSLASKLQI